MIAYAVARDCLTAGATVIADSVNAISITRDAWRQTALDTGSMVFEIEIICSDQVGHRRRVESRTADIEGHVQPTWQEVVDRDYAPWPEAALNIDTASTPVDVAVERIITLLSA